MMYTVCLAVSKTCLFKAIAQFACGLMRMLRKCCPEGVNRWDQSAFL